MKTRNEGFSKQTAEFDCNLKFCHNAWLGQLVRDKIDTYS